MSSQTSQKRRPRASLAGVGVPSVLLPNPGGKGNVKHALMQGKVVDKQHAHTIVIYISGGPPTSSPSASSPSQDSLTPTPSRQRRKGVDYLRSCPFCMHPSNNAEDYDVALLFSDAFKLLSDGVSILPPSEDKGKLSDILERFSVLLNEVSG